MTLKGRRIFWLVEDITQTHRDRAMLLNQSGYQVVFHASLTDCLNNLKTLRPHVLIIDDNAPEVSVLRSIAVLSTLPEIQGTRMILSTLRFWDKPFEKATAANFRDIVPLELKQREWLDRMNYAASTKPFPLSNPLAQVTISQVANLELPARIVAVNKNKVVFETRGRHTPGTLLSLTGALASELGKESISVEIKESARKRLVYRYSRAFVAEVKESDEIQEKLEDLTARLMANGYGQKLRAFVAIQNSELRSKVLALLEHQHFTCNVALQRSQVIFEVQFFSPDVIFYDDQLLSQLSAHELSAVHQVQPEHCKAVVFGTLESVERVRKTYPKRTSYHEMTGAPTNFNPRVRYALKKVVSNFKLEDKTAYITPDHEFSFASFSFPARLTKIHPTCGELSLPFEIDNFALCRLDSPFLRKVLGRNPIIKITSTNEVKASFNSSLFQMRSNFIFSSVSQFESAKIAKYIASFIQEQYADRTLAVIGDTQQESLEGGLIEIEAMVRDAALAVGVQSNPLVTPTTATAAQNTESSKQILGPLDLRDALDRRYENVPVRPKPKSKNPLIPALIFGAAAIAGLSLLFWIASIASEKYYSRSGGNYSDQLKKFKGGTQKRVETPEPGSEPAE